MDPEAAIKLLEIIEPKEIVSDLLSKQGSNSDNLFDYWQFKRSYSRIQNTMNL